jgi:hypothetical protein
VCGFVLQVKVKGKSDYLIQLDGCIYMVTYDYHVIYSPLYKYLSVQSSQDASEILCTHTRILELFQYHYNVDYEGSYNSNTNLPKVPQS